tara:strand:- start:731 stop:952 length:222 start_codon:yes stop_codon:yes gene_type:complete
MNFNKNYYYTLIPPLMIVISIIGLTLRKDKNKIFYSPVGITGIYLILEKELNRRCKRKDILEKIKSFKKSKYN